MNKFYKIVLKKLRKMKKQFRGFDKLWKEINKEEEKIHTQLSKEELIDVYLDENSEIELDIHDTKRSINNGLIILEDLYFHIKAKEDIIESDKIYLIELENKLNKNKLAIKAL